LLFDQCKEHVLHANVVMVVIPALLLSKPKHAKCRWTKT